ncbi:MAG: GEVED domain-containing protein, partial [Crocinitomicaceae bacterium]
MRKNYLKALVFVAGLLGYSTNSNAQYCTFTGTNSSYFINNFSTTGGVTNITNNASGFTTGGYNDATAMSVGQFAGASVNFSASFGGVGNTYGFNIWVDWNNNQVFDAAEKMYGSGAYVSTASGTITVPLGTAVGTYRMRTLANYLSTNPTACGSASGEAEDYTFTVTTPPTCMPVSALTLASASSTTANITWTAGGTETSWNIQWGAPGFTPGTGTEIGAATNPSTAYQITGLTANTNYDIYVQA